MSDDAIHVQHEFVPKLLRRKLEAAEAGRLAFIERTKKEMVPLLLAQRNWLLAHGYGEKHGVKSIEETAKLPWTHWDRFLVHEAWWYYDPPKDDVYIYLHVRKAPHNSAIDQLVGSTRHGKKWVKEWRRLADNIRSPNRRIYVSADVLTSINYWASQINPA